MDTFPKSMRPALTSFIVLAFAVLWSIDAYAPPIITGAIAGVVMDAGTGAGISGAEVFATFEFESAPVTVVIESSATGIFFIALLPPGPALVQVFADGYNASASIPVEVVGGAISLVDIELLSLFVRSTTETVVSLSGTNNFVIVDSVDVTQSGIPQGTSIDPVGGLYRTTDLASGDYDVGAVSSLFSVSSDSVTLATDDILSADLVADCQGPGIPGLISGLVKNVAGTLIVGAIVIATEEASGAKILADSDALGVYTFDVVCLGDWTIAAASGTLRSAESETIPIDAGEIVAGPTLVVLQGPPTVYVDFVAGTILGTGTEVDPQRTLFAALSIVQIGGTMFINPGSTDETITIAEAVFLKLNGSSGSVIIGAPSAKSGPEPPLPGFRSKPVGEH